jgi:hypothetical protein
MANFARAIGVESRQEHGAVIDRYPLNAQFLRQKAAFKTFFSPFSDV